MSQLTTKKAIASSFKELLLKKSLKDITINDIAKNADITRQTFYYHFADVPSLVEWITIKDAEEALSSKDNYKNWQEGFLSIFELMRKDKAFINNIYHSISSDVLVRYLYKLVYPIIYKVVNEKSKNTSLSEENKDFITKFYMYSFVSVVLEWVNKDMKEDPKTLVNKISVLLEGTIDHCINNMK